MVKVVNSKLLCIVSYIHTKFESVFKLCSSAMNEIGFVLT